MSFSSFQSLRDLHDSANNLLRSPDIKRDLSHHKQDQKWVRTVSELSLKMLDSCGTTKDILCLVKGHIQELQSRFRRVSLGETEKKLSAYHLQREDLKKQMLQRLNSLKKMKNKSISSGHHTPVEDNLTVVANALREVRQTMVILLESLMLLMSMPNPNPKTKKSMNCNGVFVAKVKFTRVNSLSPWENSDAHALRSAIERLEAVESAMEDLEVELGCIFKRLIQTRVLLLNILTN